MKTHYEAVIRQRLEAMAARLRSEAATTTDEAFAPHTGVRGGELSNVPFHLADMGTEEFLSMMNAAVLENELQLAVEVGEALERLDGGTYGICETCGGAIAADRLKALPFARYCIACARASESAVANVNTGRPRGPGDTLAPEGKMLESRGGASAGTNRRDLPYQSDEHAAGEAGGGGAMGGLAGTNVGHGDPAVGDLREAAGSGFRDSEDARDHSVEDPAQKF